MAITIQFQNEIQIHSLLRCCGVIQVPYLEPYRKRVLPYNKSLHYNKFIINMSSVQVSEFYQSSDDVENYNKARSALPDSVGERIMLELRKKRKTNEDVQFDLMIDVGCGGGRHTKLFAPHFKRLIGFDVNDLQTKQAQEKNNFDNVTYMVGSGEAMPVEDGSVDFAVFIFSAFLMDTEKVEKELLRVLKPDGAAIMYGDLVDDIELLDSSDNIVQFSELSQKPIDLWNDICMNPVAELARKTNDPMMKVLDRNETIFKAIHQLQKRNINFSYHEKRTLEILISFFDPGIPIFSNFAKSQKQNPFDVFAKELKKLWSISHLENKDINMRVTRGSFMIFLDKASE